MIQITDDGEITFTDAPPEEVAQFIAAIASTMIVNDIITAQQLRITLIDNGIRVQS